MSGEGSDRIPTNEEIIEDLTRNLHQAQLNSTEDDAAAHIPPDFDKEDNNSDDENKQPCAADAKDSDDDELSDDEALKNQELDLTDEEKEAKRLQALELKTKGNEEFNNDELIKSIETYTQALSCCPLKCTSERAILYSNRAASKIKLERKQSAIRDCCKAIKLNDSYVKAYLRRAKLYEQTDKLDECLEDYKKILELDPGNSEARGAVHRLPPLIEERNERLKAEMLGKLKDLGNMFLRPFGLSTNNFNLQKDPNTGGYSVNFSQNN